MNFEDIKPYPDDHFDSQHIGRLLGTVTTIDSKSKTVTIDSQGSLSYDKLILATGSQANRFGWPGQDLQRVHSMVSLQDLQSLEALNGELKKGVIVGGGLIGVELAEMLHSNVL